MIHVLEPKIFNRISAGEVVEKPASIVKEAVENSIDAKATNIMVSIENGGIRKIETADNGMGIAKDDMKVAFLPHATSKITAVEDLENIQSLGFRGEALASIASVCHVRMSSKTADSEVGYSIKIDGGEFGEITEIARVNGTTLTCSDLFYNTPARAKFLRKPKSEESEITHLMEKFMLAHPEISFRYEVDGRLVYNTSSCSMSDIIYTIYGKEVYENLIPVDYQEDGIRIVGYITKPKISKSNRSYQTLFVNNRYVENYLVSSAVQGVYESFLMKGRFPVYVLKIEVPFDSVDVNVHPSKKEVKFDNPNHIFGIVRRAVENALLSVDQIANFVATTEPEENAKELSSPYHPQGYHPLVERKEPLSDTEGSSYRKVDLFDENEPIVQEKNVYIPEYTKQPQRPLPPDFQDLKLPEKEVPVNKPGGPFYFDQQKNNTLSRIMTDRAKDENFLTADIEQEMHILGTIFRTFIVLELNDSLYFLDQHAAHERLLYDKLIAEIDNKKVVKQDLLVPFEFSIGPAEAQKLESSLQELSAIGFDIQNKQGYQYEITALPLVLSSLNLAAFVDELVKEGIHWVDKPSQFIHDKVCQNACKHAIKAGDTISKQECAYIIEQVRKGVMLCPHGRPVVLEVTRREFEKMFKRIV